MNSERAHGSDIFQEFFAYRCYRGTNDVQADVLESWLIEQIGLYGGLSQLNAWIRKNDPTQDELPSLESTDYNWLPEELRH